MISNTDLMTRLFLEQILVSSGSAKHCEIAKGCPKYISLVVEVSAKLVWEVFQKLIFVRICVMEFCHNSSFLVETI